MRVLQSLTGNVTHLDGREYVANYEDAPAKVIPAEGPVCNGVGASRGNVRWYQREAKAVTCKRCLKILAAAETEARAMHAAYMMTPEGQAQEDALAARRAEKCGQCGSERSNPRHHSAEGHAFTAELPAAEWSGMQVELATGKRYVEAGERVQHKDSGERGTVTAVGPNALDLEMADGTPRSVASWFWQIQDEPAPEVAPKIVIDPSKYDSDAQLAEATAQVRALRAAGPIDRRAVLSTRVDSLLHSGVTDAPGRSAEQTRLACRCTAPGQECTAEDCPNTVYVTELRLYTPSGEAMLVLGSDVVHGHGGLWAVREGNPVELTFFASQEHLALHFSAYRPGERARLMDTARLRTPLATPDQVANLATVIAQQAELYAAGGVSGPDSPEFRSRMERNVRKLAAWLGMSEPVKLVSYPSPYGGPELAELWQARAGVQMPLCRVPSSRWTTYGATCNTPLNNDGTCPEARAHV